jgi:hypothetical protein
MVTSAFSFHEISAKCSPPVNAYSAKALPTNAAK